ncbi:MAG: hypothetical protein WBI17_11345 [Clostridiaceae bacterium]
MYNRDDNQRRNVEMIDLRSDTLEAAQIIKKMGDSFCTPDV